jgi:hypothetical protein
MNFAETLFLVRKKKDKRKGEGKIRAFEPK